MNAEQLAKMCHQPQDGLALLAPADHFFTLYTGQASDNIPINYETSTEISIWNEVTKDLAYLLSSEAQELNLLTKTYYGTRRQDGL